MLLKKRKHSLLSFDFVSILLKIYLASLLNHIITIIIIEITVHSVCCISFNIFVHPKDSINMKNAKMQNLTAHDTK